MLFLRSALFSLNMIVATVVAALLIVFCAPMPHCFRYRIGATYARYVIASLRVLCGIDFVVEGSANIPRQASLIYAKHQSAWETYALQLIFPMQTWVLKRELMWVPFFGWGMALLKPIAIDRGAGRKAVKQVLQQGKARLEDGIWITIFPEGTRVAVGKRKKYGIGGALLAEHSGRLVVPVAHNAGHFWGRRQFLKRPGTIRVAIGQPIDPRGKSALEINAAAETWMETKTEEITGIKAVPLD